MNPKNIKRYSPVVARLGVGIVFFIFGIWQLVQPSNWFGYLPGFALNFGFSPNTLILINGIFDLIIGLALIRGIFIRVFAALGALHLLFTGITLGFNDVSIRDFGLLIVLVSIILNGPDEFCLKNKSKI